MTYRNTRPAGFKTDPLLNARVQVEGLRRTTPSPDEGTVWFGSHDPDASMAEARIALDQSAEETSENEGMAEHAEKSADPARWARSRGRRTA